MELRQKKLEINNRRNNLTRRDHDSPTIIEKIRS